MASPIITHALQSIGFLQNNDPLPDKILRGREEKIAVKIASKTQISHDTFIWRLSFYHPHAILGLPVGQCIRILYKLPN